jgi:hypothetical protein
VQRIASAIGKARSQTVYILQELIAAGWLQRIPRKTERLAQTSSEYIVRLDGGAAR